MCVCEGERGGGNHWGERKLMLPLGLLFSLWCIFSEDLADTTISSLRPVLTDRICCVSF